VADGARHLVIRIAVPTVAEQGDQLTGTRELAPLS
jgi:hypothetical protein